MKSLSEILSFIQPLDGWLSSHEGYFLYHAAKETKGKGEIVEIGSWKGKSTICLASGSRNAKVTAIDPHKGEYSRGKGRGKDAPTYKEFMHNLKKAKVSEKVIPVVATSEEAGQKWKKPIKLLFIDGLHDYAHTKQDYDIWSPLLTKNGVIALHDAYCGHEGPGRVILEKVLKNSEYKEIGVVGSIIYAKKGKATFFEKINLLRTKALIHLALTLHKKDIPFSFFIFHRLCKVLLLNPYTFKLLF